MNIEHIGIHGNNLNYKKIGKILYVREKEEISSKEVLLNYV